MEIDEEVVVLMYGDLMTKEGVLGSWGVWTDILLLLGVWSQVFLLVN